MIVANAGICSEHAAEDYSPKEFQEIMEVNVNGAFHTAQAAAKIFKRQGYGNVIFTASVSALLVNTPQRQAAVSALCDRRLAPKLTSTVQRIKGRRSTAGKVTRSRVGRLLSSQCCLSRLHPNSNHGICSSGYAGQVAYADSRPPICFSI